MLFTKLLHRIPERYRILMHVSSSTPTSMMGVVMMMYIVGSRRTQAIGGGGHGGSPTAFVVWCGSVMVLERVRFAAGNGGADDGVWNGLHGAVGEGVGATLKGKVLL